MRLEKLSEGFVCRNGKETGNLICAGPRCTVTREGDLLVSYMVQSKLGVNDFLPALSRSHDAGKTWTHQGPIWPDIRDKLSFFGSISRALDGELFFYGTHAGIDVPGELCWCEETHGVKMIDLGFARSGDSGKTWSPIQTIAKKEPCGVEAPGPLAITRSGIWLAPYAPYNSFDPGVRVRRNRLMVARSDNRGRTWRHIEMINLPEGSGAAESWIIELEPSPLGRGRHSEPSPRGRGQGEGLLLTTCWHMSNEGGGDFPNAFAISTDAGLTWQSGTTGTMGQSTALTALQNGRALFLYNDRKSKTPGVRMAVCQPSAPSPLGRGQGEGRGGNFNALHDTAIWSAAKPTQSNTTGDLTAWTDFSFGEPSAAVLPDGAIFDCLWCLQPGGEGIPWVKLRLAE